MSAKFTTITHPDLNVEAKIVASSLDTYVNAGWTEVTDSPAPEVEPEPAPAPVPAAVDRMRGHQPE